MILVYNYSDYTGPKSLILSNSNKFGGKNYLLSIFLLIFGILNLNALLILSI